MRSAQRQTILGRVQGILLAGALVGAAWVATVAPNPPGPVRADAPPTEFSAERAVVHVRAVAQDAHPIGSKEDAAVREYISERLKALGLTVEAQSFPHRKGDREVGGVNLMARIPGVPNSNQPVRAVALVCHHDSAPTGPGASDDGAAVATLLETARALKASPPLQNDVILLFTDGEEEGGQVGAKAFAERCAWMKDIGCVLNFEARGVNGPVFMFETSAGNGRLISEFAEAAPRPVANSLMYEVYRHMPNDTDFSTLKRAGLRGFNFAFIGEPWHYHMPTDDAAHFHTECLQHDGSYALSLARHFGNLDLDKLDGPDAVYFDLFGRMLVHYPAAWAIPLACLAAVVFLATTALEFKRGRASAWKVVFGCLVCALDLVIVWVLFRYGLDVAGWLSRGMPGWIYQFAGWPYWFAAVGLTVAINGALHVVLRRWMAPVDLSLGGLFWWVVLAIATAIKLPGASYVSFWPLLFGLLGVVAVPRAAEAPWRCLVWLVLTALPAIILVAPLVQGFYVALGPRAMLVPMMVLALGLSALSLQMEAVSRTWKWTVPAGGALVAVVAVLLLP